MHCEFIPDHKAKSTDSGEPSAHTVSNLETGSVELDLSANSIGGAERQRLSGNLRYCLVPPIPPSTLIETKLFAQRANEITPLIKNIIEWAQSFELQICLELIRNTPLGGEVQVLRERMTTEAPKSGQPFGDYDELAARAWQRLEQNKPIQAEPSLVLEWRKDLVQLLRTQTSNLLELLTAVGREDFIQVVSSVVEPDKLYRDLNGLRIDSDTDTPHWALWCPGLANDQLTLGALLGTLPGLLAENLPAELFDLEDPSSPGALPGAVTLAHHDVIHALLGRGLMDQDEAFVIGFTMGNASEYRDKDGETIKAAFKNIYPEPYRITGEKLLAFDLGVAAGRAIGVRDIADLPIETMRDITLGELRHLLGISTDKLKAVYAKEKELIPSTLESCRLSVDA